MLGQIIKLNYRGPKSMSEGQKVLVLKNKGGIHSLKQ